MLIVVCFEIYFNSTMIDTLKFLAKPGNKFKLKDFETNDSQKIKKEAGKTESQRLKEDLIGYQKKLYAGKASSVLLIFQAMDAAGKDSTISHVMAGINPQGCEVSNFSTPTDEEYRHDFLWRHAVKMPPRGIIGIHNRSHYENVLVCKVHPKYVLNEQIAGLQSLKDLDKAFWKHRYESIQNFEEHLTRNGTIILKFFLHVSKEEQRERFLKRIDNREKNWKFNANDLSERALWDDYMNAYEEAIQATSTEKAPWYIIPSDKKWYARLLVSEIFHETMEKLNPKFPHVDKAKEEAMVSSKIALTSQV